MALENMKIERFIWHNFNLFPFVQEGTSAFKKEVTHKSPIQRLETFMRINDSSNKTNYL